MLAPVTHILPLTSIRRERLLPVPGRVVVRAGQKVSAIDVVADARTASEHVLLDVRRGLGVSLRQADKLVQYKVGDRVTEGDVIAGPVGLFPRVIRAPRAGRVVAIGGGQVLLEIDTSPYALRAGIPGVVSDLIPDRGAVIENTGALVQGVWGNGPIDIGMISILAQGPEDTLTADRLDVSMRGSILLAGHCGQVEALREASELPLRGLILASLSADLVPVAAAARFPIIVLEGFGKLPMNPVAFKILSTNEKREITVNAEAWDRFSGTRPEVIIPLPSVGQISQPHDTDIFAPGQIVRIRRAPYTTLTGTLVSLKPGLTALPSGIQSSSAVVRLENGDQAIVPLANMDVLE